MTYLITFSTYGSHLHGDERGSVDPKHNLVGAPLIEPSLIFRDAERRSMLQDSYVLDEARREIVLRSIIEVCAHRQWPPFVVHVRQTHIHVVVETDATPERAAKDFKRYASRALTGAEIDIPERKRWARGESTRRLVDREARECAIHYVAAKQGAPMALFVADGAVAPKRAP